MAMVVEPRGARAERNDPRRTTRRRTRAQYSYAHVRVPTYRVHFWIDGAHQGPFEVVAPDPQAGLETAIIQATEDGVVVSGDYEQTIAELDGEGHWRLL